MLKRVVALMATLVLVASHPAASEESPAEPGSPAGTAMTPASPVAGPVRIEIGSPVDVRSAVVRLGDIARISGAPGNVAGRLSGLEIGMAPLPGKERTLSLAIVRVRLRQAGFDPDDMVIVSPTTIVVRARATRVPAGAIAAAVRDYMKVKMPWGERDAEVAVLLEPGDEVLAPEGEVSIKVEALPTTRFIGSTSVRVTVLVDKKAYRAFPVRVRVDVAKALVVAARTIEKHEMIMPSDVRLETRDLARVPEDVAFDPAAVVGMRASHTIPAGRPVARSSVEPPPIVRKGDAVTIEAVLAGVVVRSPGEALEDGCEGARIRVRNTSSGAIIRAKVVSAKVVQAV